MNMVIEVDFKCLNCNKRIKSENGYYCSENELYNSSSDIIGNYYECKSGEVFSFGESENDKTDKWYAKKDGVRIPCGEYEIDKLWWQWIIHRNSGRADDEKYTIFTVSEKGLNL